MTVDTFIDYAPLVCLSYMYFHFSLLILFINIAYQQRQQYRQARAKSASSMTQKEEMPQPNRNFDPPGQGGFNPFTKNLDLSISNSISSALDAADSIDNRVQQYTSSLSFDSSPLIPQPFSPHLMPLSGHSSEQQHYQTESTVNDALHYSLEPGHHYILSISPPKSDSLSSSTIITIETSSKQDTSAGKQPLHSSKPDHSSHSPPHTSSLSLASSFILTSFIFPPCTRYFN